MVWTGILANRKTDLVIMDEIMTARRYIAEVLQPHIIPYAGAIGDNFILIMLMRDNARPEVAWNVGDYLTNEGVEVLDWPACSPDLNPVEHLCSHLKRNVYRKMNDASTFALADLRHYLQDEWENVPQRLVKKLVYSMRRRCE